MQLPDSAHTPGVALLLALAAGSAWGADALPATPPPAPTPTAGAAPAPSPAAALPAWVADFQGRAVTSGIKPETATAALGGVTLNEQVARLDRNQAEYNSTFSDYLRQRVNDGVVSRGRAELARHADLLKGLSERHGIPGPLLVALWGLESGYGANTGTTPVLPALATLAFDGRRRASYETELLALLRLAEAGEVDLATLKGSWAGALGQVQFMPTTFQAHAVDADGDGRRDLWGSVPDALTSAAGYLAHLGWRANEPWGVEVLLPAGFDPVQAEVDIWLDTTNWAGRGLLLTNGAPLSGQLPAWPKRAALVLPSGADGPAFLVFHNFTVLMEWNRSVFYALTAGHLANRIGGGGPLTGRAPASEQPLRRADLIALQQGLSKLGFQAGGSDGMLGLQTRKALRAWQHARGLRADGYPTPALVARVVAESGVTPPAPGPAPKRPTPPPGLGARASAPAAAPATGLGPPATARPTPATTPALDGLARLDRLRILALQRRLKQLGYYQGAEDGVLGEGTRAAIAAYRANREKALQTPALAPMDR